ncbi:hypothetical protein [Acetobacter indonesiensis]
MTTLETTTPTDAGTPNQQAEARQRINDIIKGLSSGDISTSDDLIPLDRVQRAFAKALKDYKNKKQLLLVQGQLSVDADTIPRSRQFAVIRKGENLPDLCWTAKANKRTRKPESCWVERMDGSKLHVPLAKLAMVASEGLEMATQLLAGSDAYEARSIRHVIGRHICSNANCINPAHIVPDTQAQNMSDETASPIRLEVKVEAVQKMLNAWKSNPTLKAQDIAKRRTGPAGKIINWLAEETGRSYPEAKGILNKLRSPSCRTLLDEAEQASREGLDNLQHQQWVSEKQTSGDSNTSNNVVQTSTAEQDRQEVLHTKPHIEEWRQLHHDFYGVRNNPWLAVKPQQKEQETDTAP